MTGMRVADLLALPHARAVGLDGVAGRAIRSVGTDTRNATAGTVFVALRGARFDGHDFVRQALQAGALLCVVSASWHRRHAREAEGMRLLVVRDTLVTLGDIARAYRERFPIPVLGITGSNGKTGTKDLVAAVLKTRFSVLRTEGNFNNQIGLPATLFRLRPSHDLAVVELGTNQPGDIPSLCAIAEPTHGLITNIGRAHIEKLLSREGIAAEKSALYRALPRDGVAFVNADEPLLRASLPRWLERVTFGVSRHAAVRISDVQVDGTGRPRVRIDAPRYAKSPLVVAMRVPGRHAAMMAAAALAVGFAFGCDTDAMVKAIGGFTGGSGRLQVATVGGIRLIDDTYNANPDSTIAALDTLAAMSTEGRRIAVLGDMLELGAAARAEHRAVGEALRALDIPFLLTCGRHAKSIAAAAASGGRFAQHFTDTAALQRALEALASPGDTILVKGSRGMHMEDIVTGLRERLSAEATG
ncbi:MAG: UDP-N-acetylmuramoyl-tripeptide--D-alanyl-D-alanine ligase [Ignavibacteria bacterium]|nr:UDP-N-acetylmuramoyl-tripeptide--D-alanyl-D-alanine ligase [Ignavibacteria bacterium]